MAGLNTIPMPPQTVEVLLTVVVTLLLRYRFADNFPNTTGEEILAAEFLLCQGIRFAFDVRHPYRALEGAIMELKQFEDVEVRVPWSSCLSPFSSPEGKAEQLLVFF